MHKIVCWWFVVVVVVVVAITIGFADQSEGFCIRTNNNNIKNNNIKNNIYHSLKLKATGTIRQRAFRVEPSFRSSVVPFATIRTIASTTAQSPTLTSPITTTTTTTTTTTKSTTTMLSCTTSPFGGTPTASSAATPFLSSSPRRINNSSNNNFNYYSNQQQPQAPRQRHSVSLGLVGRFPPRGGSSLSRSKAATPSSSSLFASASGEAPGCPFSRFAAAFGSVWGSFGVVYILAKAISRVLPIALEPLMGGSRSSSLVLSPLQWSLYAVSCLFFAYAEGYKGFHKKFAPLVVKRSFTLVIGTQQGNNPLNFLLAPFYSMGLWGATPKRLTVSWGVTLGVALLVSMVKRLPNAPRCILDAGVVVGLTIGSASILYHFMASLLTGKLPDVDACLPRREKPN